MKRKKYIRGDDCLLPNQISAVLSEEDRLFALLVANGVPANQAYHYTHRNSNASLVSCASTASRLLSSEAIQSYLRTLRSYWSDGRLGFNERVLRGL